MQDSLIGSVTSYDTDGINVEVYGGYQTFVDITAAAALCEIRVNINETEYTFILDEDGTPILEEEV